MVKITTICNNLFDSLPDCLTNFHCGREYGRTHRHVWFSYVHRDTLLGSDPEIKSTVKINVVDASEE